MSPGRTAVFFDITFEVQRQERGRPAREFLLADLPQPVFWHFARNTGRMDCIQRQPPTDLTVFNSINSPPGQSQSACRVSLSRRLVAP
jgi:hypothetical protein